MKRPLSSQQLASRFVNAHPSRNLGHLIERNPEGWKALLARVGQPRPGVRPSATRLAMEKRLRAALPKELQGVLLAYSDAGTEAEVIAADAGFLVGLELGRRLRTSERSLFADLDAEQLGLLEIVAAAIVKADARPAAGVLERFLC